MTCEVHKTPTGDVKMIVCGSFGKLGKKCQWCQEPGILQCDWIVGEGRTCDAYMCRHHSENVGKDQDLCPDHSMEVRE